MAEQSDLVSGALEKIKPVLSNEPELKGVIENLTAAEKKALKEKYIPLVRGKPHWIEDQKVVSKISPLL